MIRNKYILYIGSLIRTHCHCSLTGGPAVCLTSRCVTLDGAAIMLQAACPRSMICCSGRLHKLHLHAKRKKYSWLIWLSAPMHNDFAACVWLLSSLPFCHWRTVENEERNSSSGLRNGPNFKLLCILCLFRLCWWGSYSATATILFAGSLWTPKHKGLWKNSPAAAYCLTISIIDLTVTGWFMWGPMTGPCLVPWQNQRPFLPLEVR